MISEAKKHRKNMDSDVPAKNCIIDDGKLKEMKNLEQITLKNHKHQPETMINKVQVQIIVSVAMVTCPKKSVSHRLQN